MRRFFMGEDPIGEGIIDRERRDAILRSIASAREVMREIDERLGALPSWALAPEGPFGEDAVRLAEAGRARAANEPVVAALEQRLLQPGPIWAALTETERKALDAWIAAGSVQGDILDKHVPTQSVKDVRNIVLAAIGLGSIFASLFFEDEEPEPRKRVFPKKPFMPPGVGPTPFRPIRPTPTSVAEIPIPIVPSPMPTPPPRPVTSPFRGTGPAAAVPVAAVPVTAAPVAPEGSPLRAAEITPGVFRVPVGAPTGSLTRPGPHIPVYPRYQRTT